MISHIDVLLCRWAAWSIKSDSSALGYPKVSPMFRDTPRCDVYRSVSPSDLSGGDYSDITKAIDMLPLMLRQCISEYYKRTTNATKAAAKLGIGKSLLYKYLNKAHIAIDSYLRSRY